MSVLNPILRGIREISKMALSARFLCCLLAGSAPYLAHGFDPQERIRLLDYGRFPLTAKKNASWLYAKIFNQGTAHGGNQRVTIINPAAPVKMWKTGTASYQISGLQVFEEEGAFSAGKLLKHGLYSDYRLNWEYWGRDRQGAFFGADLPYRLTANPKLVPHYRLNPAMLYPETMKVGDLVKSFTGYYEDGVYLGEVPYTITLMERGPVRVPAGRFPDGIRLRVTIGESEVIDTADEWWVKGVGVVKIKESNDSTWSELVAYNLEGNSLLTPGALLVEGGTTKPSIPSVSFGIFPPKPYGSSSKPKPFTLTNIGDGPLVVSLSNDEFYTRGFEIQGLPRRFTLLGKQSRTFTVRYVPSDPDETFYNGLLRFSTSNSMDGYYYIELYGGRFP
jgi:hypothetical protein